MRWLHQNPRHRGRCRSLRIWSVRLCAEIVVIGSVRIRMLLAGAEKISPTSSVMMAIMLTTRSVMMRVRTCGLWSLNSLGFGVHDVHCRDYCNAKAGCRRQDLTHLQCKFATLLAALRESSASILLAFTVHNLFDGIEEKVRKLRWYE